MNPKGPAILYCHCQYAQVVPPSVKEEVLRRLCDADIAFEAVPDLCEMSARRDPTLKRIQESGPIKIAACFPRAVKWLFAASGKPLDLDGAEVVNMRTSSADEIMSALLDSKLNPNLPRKAAQPGDAPQPGPTNLPSI
jgi:hypothetical protein